MSIATANRTMNKITVTMTAINQTVKDTQKIVKTTDAIASQPNLLALIA